MISASHFFDKWFHAQSLVICYDYIILLNTLFCCIHVLPFKKVVDTLLEFVNIPTEM